MKAITLFYDADCGICTACVDWLARQAQSSGKTLFVIAYQDEKEIGNFPMIDKGHADLGIQTLSFDGKLRRDAAACAACLRELPRWRWLGICMDWPLSKSVFQAGYRLVANNRRTLSRWFGLQACRVGKAPGGTNPIISKQPN